MSPRSSVLLTAIVLSTCVPAGPRPGEPTGRPKAAAKAQPNRTTAAVLPPVRREFRGVWVATVANIDWPSEPGLPVADQKAELLAILERARELNLNAVILQVRPAADALYDSPYEPWSEYLTGKMGAPPEPYYDPLAFAVREAHRRGLELHAWFNPYRAHHPSGRSEISADHIARAHPELVREYGDLLWMDPGEEAVQEHSLRVILDVVRRYDIDGIHLDDYFYPYQVRDATGAIVDFPDDRSWQRYVDAGGTLERDDWRRHNVDEFIRRLYAGIKALKPRVKFGISPFGIWRPGHPPQIEGYDAYARLYADARKWLRKGWVDYLTPQLYWPVGQTAQSYPVLLNWWAAQNVRGRHLWPGSIPSRVRSSPDDDGWPPSEILTQIYIARGHPGVSGNVHFSMRRLMRDDRLTKQLAAQAYAAPALVPASPWLDAEPPGPPAVVASRTDRSDGRTTLMLEPAPDQEVWLWVVRARWGSASVRDGSASDSGIGSGSKLQGSASVMPFMTGSAPTSTAGPGSPSVAGPSTDVGFTSPHSSRPTHAQRTARPVAARAAVASSGSNGRWTVEVVPGWKRRYVPRPPPLPETTAGASAVRASDPALRPIAIAVSAVDRTGNIGPATTVRP